MYVDITDHSVVLTEDTDSFIIGERVWVGGTKPGQIAYIGETQFAPGDWAGIVLDDPIGKPKIFRVDHKDSVLSVIISNVFHLSRKCLPSRYNDALMKNLYLLQNVYIKPTSFCR